MGIYRLKKLTIKGYEDSHVASFANEHGIPFIPLGEPPATTTDFGVSVPPCGDLNGDDVVSVEDALLTLKASTKRITENDMKLRAATGSKKSCGCSYVKSLVNFVKRKC